MYDMDKKYFAPNNKTGIFTLYYYDRSNRKIYQEKQFHGVYPQGCTVRHGRWALQLYAQSRQGMGEVYDRLRGDHVGGRSLYV